MATDVIRPARIEITADLKQAPGMVPRFWSPTKSGRGVGADIAFASGGATQVRGWSQRGDGWVPSANVVGAEGSA